MQNPQVSYINHLSYTQFKYSCQILETHKRMFILLLIILVYSDELVYTDYESDTEYDWSALQAGNPYSIESGDDIIKFTIGDDLSETCQGQKASVIRFSKAGDSCEILGRHQITFLSPFKKNYSSGIGVFYEGGSLCRDQLWGDIKRRTEFRLMCSKKESDFIFVNILSDCTTVLEKYSSVGCSKEVKYSPWVKILFFT